MTEALRTERFEILNRWTGKVQFTAEIICAPNSPSSLKLGLAVQLANLSGAILRDAILRDTNLSDTNLSGANLRSFKADFWEVLTNSRPEISGLLNALQSGKVDGSTYTGTCACLVGTIANVRGVKYSIIEHDCYRPAEQWFTMIGKGDLPTDETGGGFASKTAVEWIREYCALTGIELPEIEVEGAS